MLKWWRIGEPQPPPGTLYIAMVKTYDIDKTIANGILNAAPGMVAVGGPDMIKAAEEAAVIRRTTHPEFRRIIWWWGPHDASEFREDSLIRKIKYVSS